MYARIYLDPTVPRGTGDVIATTFNAPGITPVAFWPGSHNVRVTQKIRNPRSFENIANYQIAHRDGNLRRADPIAVWGTNLGVVRLSRSVSLHPSPHSYHGIREFFEILSHRSTFVREE